MTKPTYEELQAQVERLQNLILEVINTDADEFFMMGTDWGGAAIASLSETPAQSLVALKAQWQAEVLDICEKELISSVNVLLKPHIAGVFAVIRLQMNGANK